MNDKLKPNNVIAAHLVESDSLFVEQAIFNSADPAQIVQTVDAFCSTELGSAIAECLFYESSQASVIGFRLADNRRVVVKVHPPSQSLEFLAAVYRVQSHLANHGFPCPMPIIGPTALARGYAIVEEVVDDGVYADAHEPSIRCTMAETLFWLVDLTRDLRNLPGLHPGMLSRFLPSRLWPTPHSQIFDFEATARGSEWIDRIASKARQSLLSSSPGEAVIGHTDWSVKHFRFVNGMVRVIYDWDSLALEKEPVIVGDAARGFPMTWHLDVPLAPTLEELWAFVEKYEAARGAAFTTAERATIAAAAAYALAYSARCENCFNSAATNYPAGSFREALSRYGEALLAP
jgi:Phosphotransferase enzyme family